MSADAENNKVGRCPKCGRFVAEIKQGQAKIRVQCPSCRTMLDVSIVADQVDNIGLTKTDAAPRR